MKSNNLLNAIALILALYIAWQIHHIILLAFTSVILATVLNRLVRQLQRQKIKRNFAVILTVIITLLITTLFILIVAPSFISQFRELIKKIPQSVTAFNFWLNGFPPFISNSISSFINNLDQFIQGIVAQSLNNFFSLFSSTVTLITSILLVMVLTIMFLATPQEYRRAFLRLFPASFRSKANDILDQCEESVVGWSIGILFNMSVITILSGIGLWIIGVPLALANALLAGLLTLIPNIGPTISVIPPVAIAFLESPWKSLGVLILYIAIQQIESNLLTPIVMKKQVSLLPALTLLSQVLFSVLFGFLGLLLALPLMIIAQILLQDLVIKPILDNH